MALTKEDLQAIKAIVDERLDRVDERLDRVDEKLDRVDERLDRVDERLDRVDERLDKVDERLDKVDERFDGIETRLNTIQFEIDGLKESVSYIKVVQLENGALKILGDLSGNYSDTYERYRTGADKFDKALSDIDDLKKAVSKHSEQIKELQLKQA